MQPMLFFPNNKKMGVTAGFAMENTMRQKEKQARMIPVYATYQPVSPPTHPHPNIGIGYNASEKNRLTFSYSRRDNRPDYGDLNHLLISWIHLRMDRVILPATPVRKQFELSHSITVPTKLLTIHKPMTLSHLLKQTQRKHPLQTRTISVPEAMG